MKKLNNKGLTLIELLVSLAILSIFMVTVSFFISSATKNTRQTKKQVNVQQQAQDVYDDLYDALLQSTSLIVETKERVVASGEASGSASADASGNATVRKSDGFDGMLASNQKVAFVSSNAYDSILYAQQKYPGKLTNYITDHQSNVSISSVAKYKTDSLGKMYEYNNSTYTSQLSVDDFDTIPAGNKPYVSTAQYVAAIAVLRGDITEYSEFDSGEYVVSSISTGPLEYKKGTATANTIVYDGSRIYLNRILNEDYSTMKASGNFIDTSESDSALIADNCTSFTIQAKPADNSVVLKLTLSDGGYSYTVGGTINLRNASVMK